MQELATPTDHHLFQPEIDELRQSEARYRNIVQNAKDIIYMHDPSGRFIWINEAAERLTGFSLAEACQMNIADIIAPDYLAHARQMIKQKLNGGAISTYGLELMVKNGGRMTVEINSWPVFENGDFVGIQGIARDISERKKTEAVLEETKQRYRAFIENSSEGIWLFEVDVPCPVELPVEEQIEHFYRYGYLADCNDALAQMYGFAQAKEIIGAQLSGLLPRSNPENMAYLEAFINSGYRLIDAATQEFDKDGEAKYFLNNLVGIVKDGAVHSAWGTQRDITELKAAEEALRQAEEQLLQSQKFEAIGQLAGGIAHDFNNLLTAINGYSDMALRQLKTEDTLRPKIEQIRKAGERAASLTQQLLAFSRKQMLQPEVLDLNHIIRDMGPMLRPLIGENIHLSIHDNSPIGLVKADRGQISQVVMNLVVNARDAMPQGGNLIIETTNVKVDEKYAARHVAVKPGAYVMLAVSDTGTGMAAATQERIFEPFYTTKEVGKGTGLGLSTVYGIVKQSGGNIWVYSEVGHGTTFKIYLPRIEEDLIMEEEEEAGALPQGRETIFVVEDEEQVRMMTREILEMCGYQVLEAANGVEALSIYEREEPSIDLLLTDVVMPKMSGRELAEKLTALRPQLRVLYTSGYTDDAIVHQGVIDEGTNFIQKPFTAESLAHKVHIVLGAKEHL